MLTATATRTSEYLPFKVSRRTQRLDVGLMKEGMARVGAGMRLILLRYGQPVQTIPIASDEQIVTLQGLMGTGGYVRAELRGVSEAYSTNPTGPDTWTWKP